MTVQDPIDERVLEMLHTYEGPAEPRPVRRPRRSRRMVLALGAATALAAAAAVVAVVTRTHSPTQPTTPVVAGPLPTTPSPGASADCAVFMTFRGVTYHGVGLIHPPSLGDGTGVGEQQFCNDTPNSDGTFGPQPAAVPVDVVAVEGVSPALAVAVAGDDPHTVYFAPGACRAGEDADPCLHRLGGR